MDALTISRGHKRMQRIRPLAWLLYGFSAGALLGSAVLLAVWLRPYWSARYQGEKANLRGAMLLRAPFRGADLRQIEYIFAGPTCGAPI